MKLHVRLALIRTAARFLWQHSGAGVTELSARIQVKPRPRNVERVVEIGAYQTHVKEISTWN